MMDDYPDPTTVIKTAKGERLVHEVELGPGYALEVVWDYCYDCDVELNPDGKLIEWHVAAGCGLETVEAGLLSVAEEFVEEGWDRPQWMIDFHNACTREEENASTS